MRFILNFIFFGILFYVLWIYFPDVFHTLQGWAASTVEFFKHLFQVIMEKLNSMSATPPAK